MIIITEKKCSACGKVKPIIEFYKDKHNKNGYTNACKECRMVYLKKYRSNPKNKEKIKVYESEYRKKHPLDKTVVAQYNKQYYEKNKDKIRIVANKWRERNPQKVKDAGRRSYLKFPEKTLAKFHKRRARILGGGGSHTPQEWHELCEKYNNKCLCCGEKKPLTRDHVIPISIGGDNNISNIQPLCKSCNSKKGKKHIDYRPIH